MNFILKITEKGVGVVNSLRNTLKGQDQRREDQLVGCVIGSKSWAREIQAQVLSFWLEPLINNNSSHSDRMPKASAKELDHGHLQLEELREGRKIN